MSQSTSSPTSPPPPPPTGSPPSGAPPAPPPGAPPPYGNPADLAHDSRQANIYAAAVLCWAISALFVALRFYTRGFLIRVLGPSDWSILLSLIFAGATCASVIEQAIHGSGRHIWDLNPADTPSAIAWGRAAWYGLLFYALTLCFSKVSILLLYIHLFSFRWARLGGQILLSIVAVSTVYMAATIFTACIPLRSYWDFNLKQQYCHPQSIWWSNTGLHMATDFLIFLLPMPVVWTILLPRRQKLILSGVFGLGFVVCFISILRLIQLIQVENYPNPDFTWSAAELSYLTVVEINGAIVCACVMTLKPFVARYLPGLLGGGGSGGSGGDNHINNTLAPPTIGSRPTAPEAGADRGKRRGGAGSGSGSTWVDSGYVELDEDAWGVVDVVELAEHKDGHGRALPVRDGDGDDSSTAASPTGTSITAATNKNNNNSNSNSNNNSSNESDNDNGGSAPENGNGNGNRNENGHGHGHGENSISIDDTRREEAAAVVQVEMDVVKVD
ncbi:hypothetical protein B0T24DRAFT_518844 [Lasiosphaeria ovina]|uniref:Rhodopsin domain-containing protein n=1 Tax=Lasiosphaeria ovina TaxID=92902 RepID=A0AAE0TWF6_9PEZI|nr:hypothetical protein B0T24DRAFT_518844 [Lasiosphaeria ovina]